MSNNIDIILAPFAEALDRVGDVIRDEQKMSYSELRKKAEAETTTREKLDQETLDYIEEKGKRVAIELGQDRAFRRDLLALMKRYGYREVHAVRDDLERGK
jgi:non-ribosomal peptide synthetase component E (peptide arylation enzyme)